MKGNIILAISVLASAAVAAPAQLEKRDPTNMERSPEEASADLAYWQSGAWKKRDPEEASADLAYWQSGAWKKRTPEEASADLAYWQSGAWKREDE